MTTWFKKELPSRNYNDEFNMFEKLFMSLVAPKEMMMVAKRDIDPIEGLVIYISLPSENLETFFRGFVKINETELPNEASLLIGNQTDFEERFTYPKRY